MTFRSSYPDVAIPEGSLYEFLFTDFGDRADAPALIDGPSGASVTFAELHAQVDAIAGGLAARGVGKGDVVLLLAPNSPAWVAAFHGVLRANATVSSANSLYSVTELVHQGRDCGASTIITVSPFLDRVTATAAELGIADDKIITLDQVEGRTSLADLVGAGAPAPAIEVGSNDIAVLPYSSGTTGLAKGVVLTHYNLVANICQVEPVFGLRWGSTLLAVLPFFHIYGMTVMMNNGLHIRATVVTMPKFDLPEFLRIIAENAIDYVYIAPPVAVALAKHPLVEQHDLSCIDSIFSGAAPLDAELGHAVAKRLNCIVLQGYGMTELSPVSHAIPGGRTDVDLNSVGFALPNVECKLVDTETGDEVGVGERGELWVKGPNVMREYLNNPEATAATLDADGFLHTGDVAVVTEEGIYSIVDRVKELIKYKGYQVPPAELEALLLTNDKVADVAVIGVLDADGEEIPKAFVVRQPSAPELDADEVMAYVAARIAPHKKVRRVEFVDEIPKSASGKILRKDLRAREQAKV